MAAEFTPEQEEILAILSGPHRIVCRRWVKKKRWLVAVRGVVARISGRAVGGLLKRGIVRVEVMDDRWEYLVVDCGAAS